MAFMVNHNTLAFAFGILGNIFSFMVFLAPLPTFYRIYKKKSTEGFHSLPYLVALFSSMLWLYYASVKTDAILLVTINSFGCVVEIIYSFIYVIYASRDARNLTLKLFGAMNVGAFVLILLVTHFAVHASLRVQVVGWACTSVSVSVFASPLSIMAQVIRTKSVEYMQFNLSLFLTLSAIMWFGYGLFLRDICIVVPNVLGFALGLLQMVLYAIYRNCNKDGGEKQEKKQVAMEPMKDVEVFIDALDVDEVNKQNENHAELKEKSVENCPV